MAFFTYNLDQVSLVFAGVSIRGEYGEGGAISIRNNAEKFENTIGQKGDVVRSRTNDKTATIELTLHQTSPYNAQLSALSRLDDNTPNGAGVGTFLCRDRENGDEFVAARTWIQKDPDVTMNRKSGDRVWMLFCEKLERYPGGRP